MRATLSYSLAICSLTSSRRLATSSAPSVLAKSSFDRSGARRAATSLTFTAKIAALPVSASTVIVVGEVDVDVALLAGLGADEAFLEAGDEVCLAEHELHVLALAALERLAVDPADEVDGDAVAVARLRGPLPREA